MRRALLNCIEVFVLSFGFVDLSNVHGLSSTVRILSSQLLSHMCRHTISKFFILEKSVEESLEHILGKHGSLQLFLHCQQPPLRTLTRAQQVSVPIA